MSADFAHIFKAHSVECFTLKTILLRSYYKRNNFRSAPTQRPMNSTTRGRHRTVVTLLFDGIITIFYVCAIHVGALFPAA